MVRDTSVKVRIHKWGKRKGKREVADRVASEEPLEIRVDGGSLSITLRTPGHDRELAVGFLFTEGSIRGRRDVLRVVPCRNPKGAAEGSILNLFLSGESGFDPDKLTRHFVANSSCGMCGRSSLESVLRDFEPLRPSDFRVDRKVLLGLPEKLGKAQAAFRRTGGLHAAALFDARGRLAVLREDVGRHNALDKVAGWGVLRSRIPFDRGVLLVSGRVSFEIMQKSIAMGVPVVAAIGAPSSLAVSFARKSGQTLVGFLSDRGMNLYANPQRVVG